MIEDRRTAEFLMAVYLIVVGFIVWWPTAEVAYASVDGIWKTTKEMGAPGWVTPTTVEFVTNVLLFVPLSLIGSTFRPRWRWGGWLLAGLAGTLLIELVQLLFLPGRSAAVIDVVANTLGALVGFALVMLLRPAAT